MGRKAIDYTQAEIFIYKIIHKTITDIKEVYVGHTINIIDRKNCHKTSCNNPNSKHYNLKIYQTIRENGGWNEWELIVIYRCFVKDKIEAKMIEQTFINELKPTMNTNKAYLTEEEKDNYHKNYKEHNKDKIKGYYLNNKDKIAGYYLNNKDELLNQHKQYRKNNKEKVAEYNRKYNENNKEKIEEYRKNHKDKSLEYARKYYENNKEKIEEYRKNYNRKYYENNKEKIEEYGRKYYENNKEKIKKYYLNKKNETILNKFIINHIQKIKTTCI